MSRRVYVDWCPHGTFNPLGCGSCIPLREAVEAKEKLPLVLAAIEKHLESLFSIWDSGLMDDEHDDECHGDDEYCECKVRLQIHALINGDAFKAAGLRVGSDGKVEVES